MVSSMNTFKRNLCKPKVVMQLRNLFKQYTHTTGGNSMQHIQKDNVVILFGAPLIGKGTQGEILGSLPGYFHISMGQLFRQLPKTDERRKHVEKLMETRALVPDELVFEIFNEYKQSIIQTGDYVPGRDILIVDGLPRNVSQVSEFNERANVMQIIYMTASNIEELKKRAKIRAIVEGRQDDFDEATVIKGLENFKAETLPLLEQYDGTPVMEIDGLDKIGAVTKKITEQIVGFKRLSRGLE